MACRLMVAVGSGVASPPHALRSKPKMIKIGTKKVLLDFIDFPFYFCVGNGNRIMADQEADPVPI
jgi:hypothetical protein